MGALESGAGLTSGMRATSSRFRFGQERRNVPDELFRILVLRTVIGVGIEDKLRVRQVLLQYERVHGVDDNVPAAVHDQRRLTDRLQIFERLHPRGRPFAAAPLLGGAGPSVGPRNVAL